MQPNTVNVNEMDYGKGNEWDGLWSEGIEGHLLMNDVEFSVIPSNI